MENKVTVSDSDEECTLKDIPSKIVLKHSTTTTHTHGDPIWKAVGPNYYESIPPRSCAIRQADKTCIIFKGLARLLVRDAVCAACSSGKCLLFTRTMAAKLLKLRNNLRPQNGREKWTAQWCQVGPPKTGPKKKFIFFTKKNLNIFKLWHLMQPPMSAAWKLDFLKMIQIRGGMKHWSVDVFKMNAYIYVY